MSKKKKPIRFDGKTSTSGTTYTFYVSPTPEWYVKTYLPIVADRILSGEYDNGRK